MASLNHPNIATISGFDEALESRRAAMRPPATASAWPLSRCRFRAADRGDTLARMSDSQNEGITGPIASPVLGDSDPFDAGAADGRCWF